ncbi:hypothetical protein [Anaerocolumna sp.]|uniref:hypothetical protein n=1 Tax=Anaerocolumna sp. TaxID=2041569 RepID=UPI0028B06571|nr:hypothetical protein [Anaerocolumna sp.]
MNRIIEAVKQDIDVSNEKNPIGAHMKTGDIRKISSKMFRTLSDKNIDNILPLCESLLEEHNWEMKVIAFDWANTYGYYFKKINDSLYYGNS